MVVSMYPLIDKGHNLTRPSGRVRSGYVSYVVKVPSDNENLKSRREFIIIPGHFAKRTCEQPNGSHRTGV